MSDPNESEELEKIKEETKQLKDRIKQLEASFKNQNFLLPPLPDPALAHDEWYAVFSDYNNTQYGTISKTKLTVMSGQTSVFVVKRIR